MAGQALVYFNGNITFLLQEALSIRNQEAFAITSVLVLCRWIQVAVKYIFYFIERHRNFGTGQTILIVSSEFQDTFWIPSG